MTNTQAHVLILLLEILRILSSSYLLLKLKMISGRKISDVMTIMSTHNRVVRTRSLIH